MSVSHSTLLLFLRPSPDGSITAKFVSFGATMTELWVKDRNGTPGDVVLGYDDNVCKFPSLIYG